MSDGGYLMVVAVWGNMEGVIGRPDSGFSCVTSIAPARPVARVANAAGRPTRSLSRDSAR